MIEDVEAISAQLSVTILMIWKPVIKSIHSFKILTHIDVFNNFISCHIYHIIIYIWPQCSKIRSQLQEKNY